MTEPPRERPSAGSVLERLGRRRGCGAEWEAAVELVARLAPQPCAELPASILSSDRSPIQVSLDARRPADLRLMVDPTGVRLAPGQTFVGWLRGRLPADASAFLERLAATPGVTIPGLCVGLRLAGGTSDAKLYFGSPDGRAFAGITARLRRAGALAAAYSPDVEQLCARWHRLSAVQGISIAFAGDRPQAANFYFRCPFPLGEPVVRSALAPLRAERWTPTALALAAVMGARTGRAAQTFGWTATVGADGSLAGVKLDFGRTSRWGPSASWAGALAARAPRDAACLRALASDLAVACERRGALLPEALSLRITAAREAAVVGYFTVPRDGWA